MGFLVIGSAIPRLSSEMTAPTPTINPALPFRVDGFATLVAGLDYAAHGETGFNFFSSRGELATALPYRDLRRRALDLAGTSCRLRRSTAATGSRSSPRPRPTSSPCSSPASMPAWCRCRCRLCINLGGHEAYVERLRGMLIAAGARIAVAPADLIGHAARGGARAPRSAASPPPRRSTSWPVSAGAGGAAAAPTSPATSSTPRAAPASRAACW